MMLNIEDEDVYLDQFKQLLQLEHYSKVGSESCLQVFQIDPSITIVSSSSNTSLRCDKSCPKDLKCKSKNPKNSIKNKLSKHAAVKHDDLAVHYVVGTNNSVADGKPVLAGKREERILKRRELFDNIRLNADACCSYLDLLTDLEESFIVEN